VNSDFSEDAQAIGWHSRTFMATSTRNRLLIDTVPSGCLDYVVSLDGLPLSSWRCHENVSHSASFHAVEKDRTIKARDQTLGAFQGWMGPVLFAR